MDLSNSRVGGVRAGGGAMTFPARTAERLRRRPLLCWLIQVVQPGYSNEQPLYLIFFLFSSGRKSAMIAMTAMEIPAMIK